MAPLGPIFGREDEVEAVLGALSRGERLVSVVGPPGVGKTRLVREVEQRLRDGGQRVRLVALRGVGSLSEALARMELLTQGRATGGERQVVLAQLAERLDEPGSVLILEALEALVDEAQAALSDLLDATEHLALVVASRVRLDLQGEVVRELSPLTPEAALAMLRDRLERRAATIDPALGARLVERVDGLPLGIELLASRVAAVGGEVVLQRLEQDPRGALAFDPIRHALEGSYALLAPDDRRVFAACAIFRGGFTLEDAAVVLAPLGRLELVDSIEALQRASLLTLSEAERPARHEMLAVVEAFAAAQLEELPEREALASAHASRFAELAGSAPDDAPRWARLSAERANLLAAFEHLRERAPAQAARVALGLDPVLVTQGPVALHRAILEQACAFAERAGEPALASRLWSALARHRLLRGEPRASEATARALACGEASREPTCVSQALGLHAYALRRIAGRLDEAREVAARARALALSLGDPRLQVMAEKTLGSIEHEAGDRQTARAWLRSAVAVARGCGAPRMEGLALANLALLLRDEGALREAREALAASFARLASVKDQFHRARLAPVAASLLRLEGDLAGAERTLLEARGPLQEHGARVGELEQRIELARVALARADRSQAEVWCDEAEALAARIEEVTVQRQLRELQEALSRSVSIPRTLTLDRQGRRVELGGRSLDLSRRGPLRRLTLALAEHRDEGKTDALTVTDLREAGWPGERMRTESASARVYMAIRRLRALGLASVLRTRDDGYLLDTSVRVRWREQGELLGEVRPLPGPFEPSPGHAISLPPRAPGGSVPDDRARARARRRRLPGGRWDRRPGSARGRRHAPGLWRTGGKLLRAPGRALAGLSLVPDRALLRGRYRLRRKDCLWRAIRVPRDLRALRRGLRAAVREHACRGRRDA